MKSLYGYHFWWQKFLRFINILRKKFSRSISINLFQLNQNYQLIYQFNLSIIFLNFYFVDRGGFGTSGRPKSIALPPTGRIVVKAMYAYLSSGEHQINFLEGDLIQLLGDEPFSFHNSNGKHMFKNQYYRMENNLLRSTEFSPFLEFSFQNNLSSNHFAYVQVIEIKAGIMEKTYALVNVVGSHWRIPNKSEIQMMLIQGINLNLSMRSLFPILRYATHVNNAVKLVSTIQLKFHLKCCITKHARV